MNHFEQSRDALSDGQSFGIWSLIVTFFGDMAQGADDRVSGKTLTAVCEKLGIKSQAMRVALHRLRKDGWIDSAKSGRQSAYFLTDMGRCESAKASARIYAENAPEFFGYDLMFAPQEVTSQINLHDWVSVGSEVYLRFSEGVDQQPNVVITRHNGPVPDWLCERLIPKEIADGYKDFHQKLQSISTEQWDSYSPYEIAALRVLLVHIWRRLILRHPALPAKAFPPECPVEACHIGLSKLLRDHPKPNLNAFE